MDDNDRLALYDSSEQHMTSFGCLYFHRKGNGRKHLLLELGEWGLKLLELV